MTIVVLNNHGVAQTVDFAINGLNNLATLKAIRTSQTENWAILPDITVPNNSFTATLAPNSITTFTTVNPSLGMNNSLSENILPLTIYPNPARDVINIQIPDEASKGKITLLNSNGQHIKEVQFTGTGIQQLNISHLSKGLYWVRLKDDNKTWTAKVLISK